MAEDVTNARPAASRPCVYWNGTNCTAGTRFSTDDVTCFNEGNCDGFGTCRGCSHYDTPGLKLDTINSVGGTDQVPMNLRMYNIRAKIKPCCFWDGEPATFKKDDKDRPNVFTSPFNVVQDIPANFYDVNGTYSPSSSETKCTLEAAAPWQVNFTKENPTAYGCNGAKPECPFYTGPKFTEVVDEKMESGDRVTAKQVLELRWYSADWANLEDPQGEWEKRFENPEIWTWARDEGEEYKGKFDSAGNPLLVKVSISNFRSKSPSFFVYSPVAASTGTPTIGDPPNFPDLVRDLSENLSSGFKVVWPVDTSTANPFRRETFTKGQRQMMVLVQANSDRDLYAVNVTKHPQTSETDVAFIRQLQADYPEDVISPVGLADTSSKAFFVPLVSDGSVNRLNKIKIYLDTGADDDSMLTAEVFVRHVFYHAEVAQTSFIDYYGHQQVEPWIDHFTKIKATADILDLTGNTKVKDVFLNVVNSGGKKTMFALEHRVDLTDVGEDHEKVSWEPLGCNLIAVTFKDPNVNRVLAWKAWGKDSKDLDLITFVDRSGNNDLEEGEATEVGLEYVLSSNNGGSFPANVAFFKVEGDTAVRPFDPSKDKLIISYVYEEYKQAPISEADKPLVKDQSELTKVADLVPYSINFSTDKLTVEGMHITLDNGDRISTCDEVLGECFTLKSFENEDKSQRSFLSGGLYDGEVKTATEMVNECALAFNARVSGAKIVHNGELASWSTVANALTDLRLAESHLHFTAIFTNEEGRPIGYKTVGFLTQSAVAQCRDVEIRYKWQADLRHYPNHNAMILVAVLFEPITVSEWPNNGIVRPVQIYDPFCGDHKENTVGDYTFGAFNLEIHKHGPLWYPYTQCLKPQYHADSSVFTNVVEYEDDVEGFDEGKRRYYWERMRFFDQYMPAIRSFIPQIGCFFSERTTTVNVNRPVTFEGYTRIRSGHDFGHFAADREALLVSRHWEKRNLSFDSEIIKAEDGGLTISLSDEAVDAMFDPVTQQLKEGADSETFIWTHINDGMSLVAPTQESLAHPFGRYLLERVGNQTPDEAFGSERLGFNEVFEERDYTSTLQRNEDGSQIYLPNGTTVNTENGVVLEDQGRDIRWVFKENGMSWAWLAEPDQPTRGLSGPRVTGIYLSNPAKSFFKENRTSATYMEEGNHTLVYSPPNFNDEGNLDEAASISIDDGPPLYISQTDGHLYYLADPPSPYDPDKHEGEDYKFVLHGLGPGGFGVLADSRGLQRYTIDEEKYATYAGLNVNLIADIDLLPYQTRDVRFVTRLSTDFIDEAIKEYSEENERSAVTLDLDFKGHYYVERIDLNFKLGGPYDIPVIKIRGNVKTSGDATVSGTVDTPASPEEQLFPLTSYNRGTSRPEIISKLERFTPNQRLFKLKVELGARNEGRRMNVENIQILVREPIPRSENIYTYEPKLNISRAITGTHKPSDLEYYWQRSYPQHSASYLSGVISIAELGGGIVDVTKIPGTSLKWQGKRVKDIIPIYEFSDPINNRFPYNNIDTTAIPGYTEESVGPNKYKYIDGPVKTSSKGWTLSTASHYRDPGGALVPSAHGPDGIANVQVGGQPNEDLQEYLYRSAGELLGDKVSVYKSFWHPAEIEFFADSGVDLNLYVWNLELRATVAPLHRVYQHDSYGCLPGATHESTDGYVHKIVNWQAKGVFHYQCDARYSWACFTTVMNKCETYIFRDYGKSSYNDTDVIEKYTYRFQFPPRDYNSYTAAGLFNKNEIGGAIGGTGPIGNAAFASSGAPTLSQLHQEYNSNLPIKGPGPYQ